MSDTPTPDTATPSLRATMEPVTVIVNLQLPPWPALTPPPPPAPPPPPVYFQPPPAPPVAPDPLPPPVAPDPAPEPVPVPAPKQNWINRWLGHVWLHLSDDARWFYKKVHFWMFAVVSCAPDIYNAAVDNHVLPGGHVPAPLEKFFNVIGFLGVASTLVKARQKIQSND